MVKPSPRELRAVADVLSKEWDDVEVAAREVINALDDVRGTKDQWIVVARPLADGPYLAVGPWTTRNQASKAGETIVSAHKEPTPGTGRIVMQMNHPSWLAKLD